MKFSPTPEGQVFAGKVMNAVRDGMIERGEIEPSDDRERALRADYLADEDNRGRVLLFGLPWCKGFNGRYVAYDGPRTWVVERRYEVIKRRRLWFAGMEGEGVWVEFKTMREAREHCESRARDMEGPGS